MYCSQPRKRQLMFSLFGDYRKKMEEDRRREKQGDLAKLKSIYLRLVESFPHLKIQLSFSCSGIRNQEMKSVSLIQNMFYNTGEKCNLIFIFLKIQQASFFFFKYVEPSVNPRLTTVNREEQKSIFVKVCQTKCKDSDKEVSGC